MIEYVEVSHNKPITHHPSIFQSYQAHAAAAAAAVSYDRQTAAGQGKRAADTAHSSSTTPSHPHPPTTTGSPANAAPPKMNALEAGMARASLQDENGKQRQQQQQPHATRTTGTSHTTRNQHNSTLYRDTLSSKQHHARGPSDAEPPSSAAATSERRIEGEKLLTKVGQQKEEGQASTSSGRQESSLAAPEQLQTSEKAHRADAAKLLTFDALVPFPYHCFPLPFLTLVDLSGCPALSSCAVTLPRCIDAHACLPIRCYIAPSIDILLQSISPSNCTTHFAPAVCSISPSARSTTAVLIQTHQE